MPSPTPPPTPPCTASPSGAAARDFARTAKRLDPSTVRAAHLSPPLSKSDAQRRLVLEHVLGQPPSGLDARAARDVRVLAAALATLRAPGPQAHDVDCADGGAPFRLFVGQAAVTPSAHVRIRGTPRLGERPHQPLFESLRQTLGPAGLVLEEGTPWPVTVMGAGETVREPCFRISAQESSQFATSLLLAAGALALREGRAWTVELEGALVSEGYLTLTVHWMRRAGFVVHEDGRRFRVEAPPPGARAATLPPVPGDWSSLGYLLVLSWCTGSEVQDVDLEAAHPDRAMARILGEVGLALSVTGGTARVTGTPRAGLTASGEECPDLLPTLAVLACALPAPSRLTHVHVLRAKESDRLEGIRALVGQAGGAVRADGEDALVLEPPRSASSGELQVDSQGDHRLAMCGAVLAVLQRRPAVVTEPECVAKSFPGFWGELEKLGVTLRG